MDSDELRLHLLDELSMKSRLLSFPAIALLAFSAELVAQNQDLIPVIRRDRERPNRLSVGVRIDTGGTNVRFGNLGTVSNPNIQAPMTVGENVRIDYTNGFIAGDGRRDAGAFAAVDSDGNPLDGVDYFDGAGIQVVSPTAAQIANGTIVTYRIPNGNGPDDDFEGVIFQNGQTRNYLANDLGLVTAPPGQTALYWLRSEGKATNTAEADQEITGGFEVTFSRDFGKLGERFTWGLAAGFGLSSLDAETSGTVQADLVAVGDFYTVNGITFPASFTDPDDPDPLGVDPVGSRFEQTVGTTEVDGTWAISGGYYTLRLGPVLRGAILDDLAISGSAGGAMTMVGSQFEVTETLVLPGGAATVSNSDSTEDFEVLFGFYTQLNVEYFFNRRFGLYAGAVYESFGDYDQQLRGRTADVEISDGFGGRAGMVFRF